MVSSEEHDHEDEIFEAIIAADRVDKWLDTIRSSLESKSARKAAIEDLTRHVLASPVYVEEAKFQGANHALTKAMQQFLTDEEMLSTITQCLAACSGSSALGDTTTIYRCEGRLIPNADGVEIKMREQSISQGGVGMRIWGAAAILSREMCTRKTNIFEGKHVLELGSGPGLCGILAERLGAKSVTLTDFEDPVLDNLRSCVELNAPSTSTSSSSDPWTFGNLAVRFHDWNSDRKLIMGTDDYGAKSRAITADLSVQEAFCADPAALRAKSGDATTSDRAPGLPKDVSFEVIIASDCMYEVDCCRMLAYTIRRRLAPNGLCLMINAIRQLVFLEVFKKTAAMVGLRVRCLDVNPNGLAASDGDTSFSLSINGIRQKMAGVIGKAEDYEGGYTVFLCDLEQTPFDWDKY